MAECPGYFEAMTEAHSAAACTGRGLQARDISVRLGGATILDSASLDARPGELLGLLGPNGAGKSTLLRVMAGLLKPLAGEVRFGGALLGTMAAGERARRIAFMPQHDAQHPFTALETVLMGRYPHLGRFELEGWSDREIARGAMERTDTGEFETRQLDTLSGGERQRVLLARTLAQQAAVLLLDEPAANLDLKHRLSIMDVLRAEIDKREIAVVMALHDLSLAGRYCDRLALMSNGAIAAEGAPADVLTPANLREAFEVETFVESDPVTGRPQVSLLGPAGGYTSVEEKGVVIHVICGAGSGRDVMHQLVSAGYTVTSGVLGLGDTDRDTAELLGVSFVPAPPFSQIDDPQHGRHLALIEAADVVVLCDMAVGPNNLRNVEAARSADRLLLIDGPPFESLDYTGGVAAGLLREMAERAPTAQRGELLRFLARPWPAAI